ncbi:MAG: alpha,alpha-trehalase TreF [Bacteroidota bacterium]
MRNKRFQANRLTFALTFALLSILWSCSLQVEDKNTDFDYYSSQLFKDVQLAAIFPDSKTFVDCTPKQPLIDINARYIDQKSNEGFNLKEFVEANFEMPVNPTTGFVSDTSKTMRDHIVSLWPVLTRTPEQINELSSLISLPGDYIVPGGRFREIYYWDSYFTMEGLMVSGQELMAKNMVDNFSYLIDTLSFIPNGNRNYYNGRSQPPFYALMVDRLAQEDRDLFISYLPYLESEYEFWMSGSETLSNETNAVKRVVRMEDGSALNRYWDNYASPRPESFKEDYELAEELSGDAQIKMYRDLRAGAESGWDYTSRWFADGQRLSTIHTTDIIPVDLNSLLYFLELKIAQGYNWNDDLEQVQVFLDKADRRKQAILKYLWDEEDKFFVDYDFIAGKKTGVLSLAAAYPLYFKIATKGQAKLTLERLSADFLKAGGFVTTLNETGQQWDFPNGWAPLQWITINAFYNYGQGEVGNEAATKWLARNSTVYKTTGKMMEKYDVIHTELLAGGGEYPLQDGFGWTNGVALALQKILDEKAVVEEMTE